MQLNWKTVSNINRYSRSPIHERLFRFLAVLICVFSQSVAHKVNVTVEYKIGRSHLERALFETNNHGGIEGDLLSDSREVESDEGWRQLFGVHLHTRASHVVVLPLGCWLRLVIDNNTVSLERPRCGFIACANAYYSLYSTYINSWILRSAVQSIYHQRDDRAVQCHCAKCAKEHFWAEAPEIIP